MWYICIYIYTYFYIHILRAICQHCNLSEEFNTPPFFQEALKKHNSNLTNLQDAIASMEAALKAGLVGKESWEKVMTYIGKHTATHCNTLRLDLNHEVTTRSHWKKSRLMWPKVNSLLNSLCVYKLVDKEYCNTLQHTAAHCNTLQHTASGS